MQIRASLFLGISALSLSATTAFAVDKAEVIVKATVTSECSFNTKLSPTIGFGEVKTNATGSATASTTLEYFCSTGQSYTLLLDEDEMLPEGSLVRVMTHQGADAKLEYAMSWGLPKELK